LLRTASAPAWTRLLSLEADDGEASFSEPLLLPWSAASVSWDDIQPRSFRRIKDGNAAFPSGAGGFTREGASGTSGTTGTGTTCFRREDGRQSRRCIEEPFGTMRELLSFSWFRMSSAKLSSSTRKLKLRLILTVAEVIEPTSLCSLMLLFLQTPVSVPHF
jgi:hypothetical protein